MSGEWRLTVRPGDDLREAAEELAAEWGVGLPTLIRILVRKSLRFETRGGASNHNQTTPPYNQTTPLCNQTTPGVKPQPNHAPLPPPYNQTTPLCNQTTPRSSSSSLSPTGREREEISPGLSADAEPGGQGRDLERPLSPEEVTRLGEIVARGSFGGKQLTPRQHGILDTARRHRRAIGGQVPVIQRFLALEKGPSEPHTAPPVAASQKSDREPVGECEGVPFYAGDSLAARACGMALADYLAASPADRDAARQRKAETEAYRAAIRAKHAEAAARKQAQREAAEAERDRRRAEEVGMTVEEWLGLSAREQLDALASAREEVA